MNVTIKVIPHASQRYRTPGDWWWTDKDDTGDLEIRVSKLSDWRYEMLVAVHELVEVLLCRYFRIPEWQVTAFDENYERERAEGLHGVDEEPGDDPSAPYRKEHFFATTVERLFSATLLVDWSLYEKEISAL